MLTIKEKFIKTQQNNKEFQFNQQKNNDTIPHVLINKYKY